MIDDALTQLAAATHLEPAVLDERVARMLVEREREKMERAMRNGGAA